jgi:hypothetical protein
LKNFIFETLVFNFSIRGQLEFDLVRDDSFHKAAHMLPIRHLISRSLPLRKLYLPKGNHHHTFLRSVEILDDIIIFLLKGFNGCVNFVRRLQRLETCTCANLNRQLRPILDPIDHVGVQNSS